MKKHLTSYTVLQINPDVSRVCLQMWMSARSLQCLHVSISVSTLWVRTVVSATLDTSCQDTAASVSHILSLGETPMSHWELTPSWKLNYYDFKTLINTML